nr:hypothetical protein [Serratia marcescens]
MDDPSYAKIGGFGKEHNWTKRSIFFELPYWRTNLLRHNLDVMHIEKNIFDNIFNTVMDIKDKTKDNTKARRDLALYCNQRQLELMESDDGRLLKPVANYVLNKDERSLVLRLMKEIKFSDGYASNLSTC